MFYLQSKAFYKVKYINKRVLYGGKLLLEAKKGSVSIILRFFEFSSCTLNFENIISKIKVEEKSKFVEKLKNLKYICINRKKFF